MTKKHFEALAAALKFIKPSGNPVCPPKDVKVFLAGQQREWDYAVEATADVCSKFNPNFDRARFLKACGVEEAK
jgi:hypothetical protein